MTISAPRCCRPCAASSTACTSALNALCLPPALRFNEPVAGEAIGNRLHLSFTMKGGFRTDQWLTLSADGRSATNILTARKFGVVVARLPPQTTEVLHILIA